MTRRDDTVRTMTSLDDAVRALRRDPANAQLIRDAYLGEDVLEAAERFSRSGEFAEVVATAGSLATGKVLDLGAGRGVAAYSFARAGAEAVYAVEPDASEEVGWGAISRIRGDLPVLVAGATGESLPIKGGEVDLVYVRQVLHHVVDLGRVLKECHRVLREGGMLLATREHVVDDERQLRKFLADHPVHALVGGEHAYSLEDYLVAIRSSGLALERVWGPWDSVINAFPAVETARDLEGYPRSLLRRRLGPVGGLLARARWSQELIRRYLNRRVPGRLYSFVALKR